MSTICYDTARNEYQIEATINGKRKYVPIYWIKPIDEMAIRYYINVKGKKQYLTEAEETELSNLIRWKKEYYA